MRKRQRHALLLLLPVLLIGCEKIPPSVAIADREALCRDWRHATISKRDVLTEETARQIEANNKSRPAWNCEYGKDEAKKG